MWSTPTGQRPRCSSASRLHSMPDLDQSATSHTDAHPNPPPTTSAIDYQERATATPAAAATTTTADEHRNTGDEAEAEAQPQPQPQPQPRAQSPTPMPFPVDIITDAQIAHARQQHPRLDVFGFSDQELREALLQTDVRRLRAPESLCELAWAGGYPTRHDIMRLREERELDLEWMSHRAVGCLIVLWQGAAAAGGGGVGNSGLTAPNLDDVTNHFRDAALADASDGEDPGLIEALQAQHDGTVERTTPAKRLRAATNDRGLFLQRPVGSNVGLQVSRASRAVSGPAPKSRPPLAPATSSQPLASPLLSQVPTERAQARVADYVASLRPFSAVQHPADQTPSSTAAATTEQDPNRTHPGLPSNNLITPALIQQVRLTHPRLIALEFSDADIRDALTALAGDHYLNSITRDFPDLGYTGVPPTNDDAERLMALRPELSWLEGRQSGARAILAYWQEFHAFRSTFAECPWFTSRYGGADGGVAMKEEDEVVNGEDGYDGDVDAPRSAQRVGAMRQQRLADHRTMTGREIQEAFREEERRRFGIGGSGFGDAVVGGRAGVRGVSSFVEGAATAAGGREDEKVLKMPGSFPTDEDDGFGA